MVTVAANAAFFEIDWYLKYKTPALSWCFVVFSVSQPART